MGQSTRGHAAQPPGRHDPSPVPSASAARRSDLRAGLQDPARPADTAAPLPHPLLAPPTLPGPPPDKTPRASTPAESGLRLVTERLAVPAALLFAAVPSGGLRPVCAVGTWGGDPSALQRLAETLSDTPGVLPPDRAADGVGFAAGARLGTGEGALLVVAPDRRTPDGDWTRAFADTTQMALGLLRASVGSAITRVLHEVSVHPGTFDERLALALVRLADALGLDAAVFARADNAQWRPEAIFDPSGQLVPTEAIALSDTFCAFTVQSDRPFAVSDGPGSPIPLSAPGAYLGAPVFVGGRCAGTLSAVSAAPRGRLFTDDDRALVEALARWVGSAVSGRETAQRLAAREADLSAFFNAAPMGMGIGRLLHTETGPDLQIVTVNTAAAALLGSEPDLLRGRLASQAKLRGGLADDWIAACGRIRESGIAERFETDVDGRDGRHTLATTVAPITGHDDARFTFVVENTTEARRTADRVREREAQIEALVSQAPVALFATDRAGRLSMSRGRTLDLLGLSVEHALGRHVADVFAHAPEAGPAIEAALAGHDSAWTFRAGDRTFRVQLRPRRDAADRPSGLIGVALDTADPSAHPASGATEAAVRSALLKHLDREIRSPLTSILGYADLLSEHTPPGEVAEVRDVIGRSGERLLAALDDLLDLTLLDDDAVTLHPSPVDAAAVVARVAGEHRAAAEARRLALTVWCTLPSEPILIDARLFERVVRHLVGGAVAAATGERVDVNLSAAGPSTMELSVLGSAPADGPSGGAQDTGIGLNLVHRLVRVLGGTVQETHGEAGGWTVQLPWLRVPVVRLAPPAGEAVAPPDRPASGPAADGWTDEAPAMDHRERAS